MRMDQIIDLAETFLRLPTILLIWAGMIAIMGVLTMRDSRR